MRNLKILFPLLLGIGTASPSVHAHHPSAAGGTGSSGPINVISAATLEQGRGSAAILFEAIRLDPLSNATLEHLAGNHVHAHSLDSILSPSLALAYGVTGNLTVSVRLPLVMRNDIREGHHHHHGAGGAVNEVELRGDTSGIGDLTVMGQYRFLGSGIGGTEAALLFGIKTPTGQTGELDNAGGLFDAEFQPGSGSWDGLFGLAISQQLGAIALHASGLYTVVTEGTQDTDLGDRLHYGVAVSYRLGATTAAQGPMYVGAQAKHSHARGTPPHLHDEPATTPRLAVDLLVELNGEWSAKQKSAGARDDNSGGHTLYLSPGVRLSYDTVSAFASVGIPVANELNGFQAEPDWRLFTGVAVAF